MNRQIFEANKRSNKTNFAYAHEQENITKNLVQNLVNAKSITQTHNRTYELMQKMN